MRNRSTRAIVGLLLIAGVTTTSMQRVGVLQHPGILAGQVVAGQCPLAALNFSNAGSYTSVTTQYQAQGVRFSTDRTGTATASDPKAVVSYSGSPFGVFSPSNKSDPVNGVALATYNRVPPVSPAPTLIIEFVTPNGALKAVLGSSVSFYARTISNVRGSNAPANPGTATSYDAAGKVLETKVLYGDQTIGTANYNSVYGLTYDEVAARMKVQFTTGSIAKIVLRDNLTAGVTMDDLSFMADCNNMVCVSNTLPSTVQAGDTFTGTFTIGNNGTKTWTGNNYYANIANYASWGLTNAGASWPGWPTASIAPGQSAVVSVTGKAPSTPGNYPYSISMVQNGVESFGVSCSKTIIVTEANKDLALVPAVAACTVSATDAVSRVRGMTTTPDGKIWMADNDSLVRVDAQKQYKTFPVTGGTGDTNSIASDPSGLLWFNGAGKGKIGRLNPTDGSMTTFDVPGDRIADIVLGPDNNIWVTLVSDFETKVAKINGGGMATPYAIRTGAAIGSVQNKAITTGADGFLYYTDERPGIINKITTAGFAGTVSFTSNAVANGSVSTDNSVAEDITAGPDGNVWFTIPGSYSIGKVTPAEAVTIYPVPQQSGRPVSIATGKTKLWFTTVSGREGGIGNITTTGTAGVMSAYYNQNYAGINNSLLSYWSSGLQVDANENVWFSFDVGSTESRKLRVLARADQCNSPQCSDGLDNDGDAKIDYGVPAVAQSWGPVSPSMVVGGTAGLGPAVTLVTGLQAGQTLKLSTIAGSFSNGVPCSTVMAPNSQIYFRGEFRNAAGAYVQPVEGGLYFPLWSGNTTTVPAGATQLIAYGIKQLTYAGSCSLSGTVEQPNTFDPDCSDAADNTEASSVITQCSDGLDNDSDGFFDTVDPSCADAADTTEDEAVCKNAKVLVYDLQPAGSSPAYENSNNTIYPLLLGKGYDTSFASRKTNPSITSALLSGYDVVWFYNGCGGSTGIPSSAELTAIRDFYLGGKSIALTAADNVGDSDAPGSCQDRVNAIAANLGVNFNGIIDYTSVKACKPVTSMHALTANVPNLYFENPGNITLTNTVSWGTTKPVIAANNQADGKAALAVMPREAGHGAAVFIPDYGTTAEQCNNGQLHKNIMAFLGGAGSCVTDKAPKCSIEQGFNVVASTCPGTDHGGLCTQPWTAQVTFSKPFANVPDVMVTPAAVPYQITTACYGGSTDTIRCRPKSGSVTKTGFTLECSGSPPTGTCSGYDADYMPGAADWIAIDKLSPACAVQSGHDFAPTCATTPNADGTCSSGYGFTSKLTFPTAFSTAPKVIASPEVVSSGLGCMKGTTDTLVCHADTPTATTADVTCMGSPSDLSTACAPNTGVFDPATAGWLAMVPTNSCGVVQGTATADTCTGQLVSGTCTKPFEVDVPFATPFASAPFVVVTPYLISAGPTCNGNSTPTDRVDCQVVSVSATGFRARCSGSFLSDACGPGTEANYTKGKFSYMAIDAACSDRTPPDRNKVPVCSVANPSFCGPLGCPARMAADKGSTYLRYDTTDTTWSNARSHCQAIGGDLVTIGSSAEQQVVGGLAGDRKGVWIGLTDSQTEGAFKWVDGTTPSYTNWSQSPLKQPDNGDNNEDCAEINNVAFPADGKWNDLDCGHQGDFNHGFICEVPKDCGTVSCTDSDYGNAPETKGFVNTTEGTVKTASDSCDVTGKLTEYTCSNANTISSASVTCTNGCIDGACITSSTNPTGRINPTKTGFGGVAFDGNDILYMPYQNGVDSYHGNAITFGPVCKPATCGDGILTSNEQCDDGNKNGGDGCSAKCIWEPYGSLPVPVCPVIDATSVTLTFQEGGFTAGYLSSQTGTPKAQSITSQYQAAGVTLNASAGGGIYLVTKDAQSTATYTPDTPSGGNMLAVISSSKTNPTTLSIGFLQPGKVSPVAYPAASVSFYLSDSEADNPRVIARSFGADGTQLEEKTLTSDVQKIQFSVGSVARVDVIDAGGDGFLLDDLTYGPVSCIATQCADSVDNDRNGKTDLQDPGCYNAKDTVEAPVSCQASAQQYEYALTSARGAYLKSQVNCSTTSPSGTGWQLRQEQCLLSSDSPAVNTCHSFVCLWARPTASMLDYKMTQTSFVGVDFSLASPTPADCSSTVPSGYTLASRACLSTTDKAACSADICLWQKAGTQPSSRLRLGHAGASGDPNANVDCSKLSAAPGTVQTDDFNYIDISKSTVSRSCIFQADTQSCLSDLCLWTEKNNFCPAAFGKCGDSTITAPEQCDDGNTKGGDGCSAFCKIEPGWQCTPKLP